MRSSINLTNSDRKRQHVRIQNDLEDQFVALPATYTSFKPFYSQFEDKEMIDIPKFYSKTPLLAYTVIFSMSEIESLEINPNHLNEFNKK